MARFLKDQLLREPWRFEFFQAVRLLEELYGHDAHELRRHPVGYDTPPDKEIVRFRALPSLSFPAGSIATIGRKKEKTSSAAKPGDDQLLEMLVTFMGLTGPGGVLPRHYTSLILERQRYRDRTLRDFLDVFNHRFISLFYRAWEKYRLPFSYARRQRETGKKSKSDPCTQAIESLVGLGSGHLKGRQQVNDLCLLHFAGHLSRKPCSAESLENVVADYFLLPVQVKPFQGQWLYLSPESRSQLRAPGLGVSGNNRLGINTVAGDRVWDLQCKFRVRLGPLDYEQFRDFVPGRTGHGRICQLVRFYAGIEFDFDIQVILLPDEAPGCRLSTNEEAEPPLLGWNSWLRSGEYECEVGAAVFSDETLAS